MRNVGAEYVTIISREFENRWHVMGVLAKWRETLTAEERTELRLFLARRIAGVHAYEYR